jgi:copper chaperone CopZ
MNTGEFRVTMTCEGCQNAVVRALKKLNGISEVSIDLPGQKVVVKGSCSVDDMFKAIEKTGKEVKPWTD